jgi:hypothetical protein
MKERTRKPAGKNKPAGDMTYTVMIRIGQQKKSKRAVFQDPLEAETYYHQLCERRTDYPATVVLADKLFVRKRYCIEKNWSGDRVLTDEAL